MMETKSEKEILYKILSIALLEIREEAYNTKNTKIFALADLLHNLPARISTMSFTDADYKMRLDELKKRADDMGIGGWLDNVLAQV
jgi:hypothetical protein